MDKNFEELDFRKTRLGELVLRRRKMLSLGGKIVYEVKLGEEFLMSSLFYDAEVALARLGLAGFGSAPIDVAVGGLGLGYTAQAALAFSNLRSLVIIEGLAEVIAWHERGLVPLGEELSQDERCSMLHGDFFALAQSSNLNSKKPGQKFHAVLLDIDHTPRHFLNSSHADFYEPAGLKKMAEHLHPEGIFALWSDDAPDDEFCQKLNTAFSSVETHIIDFKNPLTGGSASNSVYVAKRVY